jgi:hypothetical protein
MVKDKMMLINQLKFHVYIEQYKFYCLMKHVEYSHVVHYKLLMVNYILEVKLK